MKFHSTTCNHTKVPTVNKEIGTISNVCILPNFFYLSVQLVLVLTPSFKETNKKIVIITKVTKGSKSVMNIYFGVRALEGTARESD